MYFVVISLLFLPIHLYMEFPETAKSVSYTGSIFHHLRLLYETLYGAVPVFLREHLRTLRELP